MSDTLPCPKCGSFNTMPKSMHPEDEQDFCPDWACLNPICFYMWDYSDHNMEDYDEAVRKHYEYSRS